MEKRLPFRVVVAGSRSISDTTMIFAKLDSIMRNKLQTHEVTIISGCAKGPDTIGEEWARKSHLKVDLIPADWDRDGRSAGMIRNKIMCDTADAVIAFHDGKSSGTKNMIDIATRAKKMVRVVRCTAQ